MISDDIAVAEKIISSGEEIGRFSWVKVTRGGFLLLALPASKRLAHATLNLYQPQKWKGKCLKYTLQIMISLGLHRLLPKFEIVIGNRGVFAGLDEMTSRGELGFLLSNPDSDTRNLIGVYDIGGNLCVVKAGCGGAADVVAKEYDSMRQFADEVGVIPKCHGLIKLSGGVAYVAEFVQGESPCGLEEDSKVLMLLGQWLDGGVKKRASELNCWREISSSPEYNNQGELAALENVELLSPVMHGDLAPWNIKLTPLGEIKVLDWESAERSGFPGWDWLHYHIQRMILVQENEPVEVIRECKRLMITSPFSSYIEKAGLKGLEFEMLVSYLLYSQQVVGCSRGDLITALESYHQNV